MRPCFKFTAKAADKPAVLAIDDEIGFWGVQAKEFRASLDAVEGDTLQVEINSPGGDVFAGLGMYNMLRSWASAEGRSLTTRVTGIAASMGSVIALAGDKREMPANTFAMIHGPSSFAWGTAEEIREQADVLDKIKSSMRQIYIDRMGADETAVDEILSKDTWLTADEAKAIGFATDIIDGVQATASFNMARADLPEHVKAVFASTKDDDVPEPEPEKVPDTPVAKQIVEMVTAAGFNSVSAHMALTYDSVDAARARLAEVVEIKALCDVVGDKDFAVTAVKQGLAVAQVREKLISALAEDDEENHTDTAKKEGNGSAVSATVSPSAIWDSHNKVNATKGKAK